MPRSCSICTHPAHEQIDLALVRKGDGNSDSYRSIATQFGVTHVALKRHHDAHLGPVLAGADGSAVSLHVTPADAVPKHGTDTRVTASVAAQAAVEQRHADERAHALNVMAELVRQVERVNLLSDACDRWLRDPDDPTRYEIGPRGEDVTVVYWGRSSNGKLARKKTTLQAAMARLEAGGTATAGAEFKVADPRDLLLKAAQALHGQMSLAVTVLERVYAAQEIERFETAVLAAIGEAAPDVRDRITAALRRRQPLL